MEFPARLDIDATLYLSPPQPADADDYAHFLNDRFLYERTLTLPHPYTKPDAEHFISYAHANRQRYGRWLDFSLRRTEDDRIIGGISFHGKYMPKKPSDEIGYWLAAPFRGQGIMVKAVNRMVEHGFTDCGMVRIEAPVYAFNTASQRVLEKCGFTEEGYLRKAYFKDGVYLDARLFAIVRS